MKPSENFIRVTNLNNKLFMPIIVFYFRMFKKETKTV